MLFDNLLVACRPPRGRRGRYELRSRHFTQFLTVIDVDDGVCVWGKSGIDHALRVYDETLDKWSVLQAPSAAAKQEWIEAFRRENRKVTADRTRGIRTLNAEELAAAENDDAQDLAARRKTLVSKMSGLSLRRKQRK